MQDLYHQPSDPTVNQGDVIPAALSVTAMLSSAIRERAPGISSEEVAFATANKKQVLSGLVKGLGV